MVTIITVCSNCGEEWTTDSEGVCAYCHDATASPVDKEQGE